MIKPTNFTYEDEEGFVTVIMKFSVNDDIEPFLGYIRDRKERSQPNAQSKSNVTRRLSGQIRSTSPTTRDPLPPKTITEKSELPKNQASVLLAMRKFGKPLVVASDLRPFLEDDAYFSEKPKEKLNDILRSIMSSLKEKGLIEGEGNKGGRILTKKGIELADKIARP